MAGRQSSPARAHATGRLQHTPSHEILTSHPLLSPGSSSSHESSSSGQGNGSNSPRASSSVLSSNSALGLNNHQQSTATSTNNVRAGASSPGTPPKYLPYTPRQARSAMATTGTASSPVSGSISASPLHQQHQQQNPSYATGSNGAVTISATSRLQLQNLKAVAQNYGLDAGSVGWAMIEEIIGVRSDHSHSQLQAAAWAEIWNVITTGKVSVGSNMMSFFRFSVVLVPLFIFNAKDGRCVLVSSVICFLLRIYFVINIYSRVFNYPKYI